MREKIISIIRESIAVKEKLCRDNLILAIEELVGLTVAALKNEGKIILFGNGGSAADSQHIAAELVGRFTKDRRALAALALTGNSSNITAIGNDCGFQQIFARQIQALGQKQDLAIGISTSGNSPNVLAGLSEAKEIGMATAALTSVKGKGLAQMVDVAICVPAEETARIQEAHIIIGHIVCELTEQAFL